MENPGRFGQALAIGLLSDTDFFMKRFAAIFCLLLASVGLSHPVSAQSSADLAVDFSAAELSWDDRRFLQTALAFEGQYQGLLDGAWGRLSDEAFTRYTYQRFGTAPEGWHMVVLAWSFFERYERDGWHVQPFPGLGLSGLVPQQRLIVDAPSAHFTNWRHDGSSLSISFGRHEAEVTQGLHDYTEGQHAGREAPYSVRRTNFAVTVAERDTGQVLYTRSNFVQGGWATVMLSAEARDRAILNVVAASIAEGPGDPIVITTGGRLDRAVQAALAVLDESPPPETAVRTPPEQDAPRGSASGSGFVVSEAGHVMTNAHVVEGCTRFRVDGAPARLVDTSESVDLALLQADAAAGKAVAVFAPGPARLNSDVTAVGFPYAGLLGGLNVTRGSVSSMTGPGGEMTVMQVTAPVQKGNSGGPLIGPEGTVVGVVVSKLDARKVADLMDDVPQNVNFAVRGEMAKMFLAQNGLDPQIGAAEGRVDPVALAEAAAGYTAFIECE